MSYRRTRDIPTDGKDCANILLLGKTGAGKSSFINYFLNKDVAEASAGEPVTQELFHRYECDNGKFSIMIYDTKGLEADTANEQVEGIISTLRATNKSDNIFHWFHTIFYVVSMSTARFEPYERELIQKLSDTVSQHIHIILTHCDTCDEHTVEDMRSKIQKEIGENDNVKIFPVVSIEKRKRNGTMSCRRGKEEIEESVFSLLWSDICTKVSADYADEANYSIRNMVNSTFDKAIRLVDEFVTFGNLIKAVKDDSSLDELIDFRMDEFSEQLDDEMNEINQSYNEILTPARQMLESYRGFVVDDYAVYNDLDFSFFSMGDSVFDSDFDDMFEKIAPSMSKISSDEVNFGTVLGSIGDLFSLKSRMKKLFEEERQNALENIPSQEYIRKEAYEKLMASL